MITSELIYLPPAASLLGLAPPPLEALGTAPLMSFIPLVLGQLAGVLGAAFCW